MIGILSDSHDNLTRVRRAVRLFNEAGCDLVIHAGDFVAPFTAEELRNLRAPVKAVFGNCDGEKAGLTRAFQGLGLIQEAPLAFTHAGIRFLVCHLDTPVLGYAGSKACDVVVFGHTHRPVVESRDGVLLLNPGEAGGWLRGKGTVALFDPEARTADVITIYRTLMPHPINRRQKPAWKQPRRPPSRPLPQGGFAKRAPGRKINPPSKPR